MREENKDPIKHQMRLEKYQRVYKHFQKTKNALQTAQLFNMRRANVMYIVRMLEGSDAEKYQTV